MNPTNLFQYYQSIGQSLPSLSQRKGVALAAGIENYTGTAQQNSQLLSYLVSSNKGTVQTASQQVSTPNGIDISKVQTVTPSVTPPVSTPSSSVQVPTLQFSNSTTTTTSPTDTQESFLRGQIEKTQNEVTSLQNSIGNLATDRDRMLTEGKVFDSLQTLAKLQGDLQKIQNDRTRIPIEATQELRGRGATIEDYSDRVNPRLENQALAELAAGEQVNTLTNLINANQAQVDSYINAQKDLLTTQLNQKVDYLTSLQKNYADFITAEQSQGLEYAKLLAESQKDQDDREWDIIKDQAKIATDRGDFATASAIMSGGSAERAYALNQQATGQVKANTAVNNIAQIDDILNDSNLKISVNPSVLQDALQRLGFGEVAKRQEFIAKFNQFKNSITNQGIIELKSQAGAIGALSDKDRAGLENAAVAIATPSDSNTIRMKETDFRDALQAVKNAQMKVFIAAKIGQSAFTAAGWRDKEGKDLEDFYNLLKSQETTTQSQYFPTSGGKTSLNLPQRNNNPGNIKTGGATDTLAVGVDSQGHLIFPDAQTGFQALANDLTAKITGKSRYVQANPTIAQIGSVYAEDPRWAQGVARILGVSPATRASSVDFTDLVYAVARQEGFFA